MSTQTKSDKLLVVTRLVLTFLIWFTAAAALVCSALIPIALFKRGEVVRDLVKSGISPEALPWLMAVLALGVAMAILGFFFFRHLRRIVDSVAHGDPFAPVNADRLYYMGWLSLGLQALVMMATPLYFWLQSLPNKPFADNGGTGFSISSLVMALLLFVLARIFRVGAAMRDDLEGTV